MRLPKSAFISTLLLGATLPVLAVGHARRGPTSPKLYKQRVSKPRAASPQSIHSDRTTQIQGALIKQGYLSGTATGEWDSSTQAAMQKLQADNGWQTKLVPDSRAIIKLGLGPNSESTSVPQPESANHTASTTDLKTNLD